MVFVAVAAVAVARSPLFAIAEVRVAGVVGQQVDEVRHAAALRPGHNLLTADLRAAEDRVARLPWVRTAEARRVPPSTVQIRATPREPVAVVRLPGAAWLVDADGVVVAGGSREGLVEIRAPNSVLPGVGVEVRDAALRNAIAARNQLPDGLRAAVVRYEAPTERGLRLHLDNGVVVRFGSAEHVAAKARSLVLLLEQARVQAERHGANPQEDAAEDLGVGEIDVRAPDNPVLVPVD